MDALLRYQEGRLPQQMRHWLRNLLELNDDPRSASLELQPNQSQGSHITTEN